MRGALWVGAIVAAWVFMRLVSVDGVALSNCVPIPDQPGAVVCGGRVERRVALAAGAEPTLETIIAGPLPTQKPVSRAPLPTWLPAGVLGWEPEIHEASERAGLDPLMLAILVSIECPSGNPECGSYAGAHGLSQFMPGTAAAVETRSGLPCSDRMDPVTSLRCGAYHFVELLSMCGAIWSPDAEADAIACAGASYNAGPGYAPVMVAHVKAGGDPKTAPIPAETRRWVTMAVDMWRRAGRQ